MHRRDLFLPFNITIPTLHKDFVGVVDNKLRGLDLGYVVIIHTHTTREAETS